MFGVERCNFRCFAAFLLRPGSIAGLLSLLALTPAAASPPPGYYLVWGDEFNEPTLNTTNWSYWLLGKWNDAVNVTNAVSLNGSNLVITTYTQNGTNYTAMLASQNHFHPRYGYYESSIMWGDTNGNWSAFWLRSRNMNAGDPYVSGEEIDICEHRYVGIYGTYIGNIVSDNIHWDGYGSAEKSSGSPNVGNVATGFHTYGLLWYGDTYSFSIDGSEVWNAAGTSTPVFGNDCYILLSSEVDDTSTTWAGYIPAGGYGSLSNSTVKMTVDYCRYYAPTNIIFWTGATSAYWTNLANWVSNMPAGPPCDLTFSYLSSHPSTILGADQSVDGLIFLDTGSAISIGGTNILTLGAGGIDMVSANHNVTLNAPINLGLNQTWIVGPNNPGNALIVNASLLGSATLTKACYGALILSGTNSFSGVLNVDTSSSATNDGTLVINGSAAISHVASPINIRNSGQGVSTLQFSNSVVVPQLISVAGRSSSVASVDALSGSNILAGGLTLTSGGSSYVLQSESSLEVDGSIAGDGSISGGAAFLRFEGSGNHFVPAVIQNGGFSSLGLINSGSGTLTLSGMNTYTGETTNLSGALVINGSVSSPMVVKGGVVAGVGTIYGDTTVQGGEISAGNTAGNSIGTLSIQGGLTIDAGGVMMIQVNAADQTSDLFNVSGTLNCGGTLYVVNIGGNLAPGQSFSFFKAGQCVGAFSSVVLPWLDAGMAWNTNNLANGVISIISVPRPPAPGNAYASAIRSYQPAGYWPLQETNAPASTPTETNLGTLGPLGNAYYPDTNPADVAMDAPSAIAGDPDTAVTFNASAQPFAFVPRTSPAMTLEPPFTLEAWLNPLTLVYGVVIGEGGGSTFNGGPTYGGFQFAWAAGNTSHFETLLYHYGINSSTVLNTPTGDTTNTWYHYVFTYDTFSNAVIYLNGSSVASTNMAYLADSWSPLTIGNGKWSGLAGQRGVSGIIDEVAVYTNLLSPSDILNHYSTGTNASPATPYKQVILNDNPLLYFRMDNPGSTAPGPVIAPVAVNFGSAPVDAAYLPGTVPAGVPGPACSGMDGLPVACMLNGIFSCIDAGYDPSFNPTNGQPFTALVWFKSYPADASLQALMGRGSNSWALNLDGTSGKLAWNSGAGSATSIHIFNDGNWHQAAGVYDGTNNYLYVDGAIEASNAANGTLAGNTNHLYLGGDPSFTTVGVNEHYFGGAIAQAAFFDSALSLSQIQTTYYAAMNPAPLSFTFQNLRTNLLQLNWNYGLLQSSAKINGPYTDVSGASSPWLIQATNPCCFYRIRH